MKNISIWKSFESKVVYPKLESDIVCDILIIGGGITGVNCLYQLENSNLDVVLVEQNRIGMSVTANSTGKLTYLQDSIYNDLLKCFDFDKASLYLKSQREAMELAVDIINKNKLNCDLEKSNSYVYTNSDEDISKLKELEKFLEDNNIDVMHEWDIDFLDYKYVVGVCDTYLFHPLKFVSLLCKKCKNSRIFEETSVKKIDKEEDYYVCYTDNNKIKAKRVVLASHYPYFTLPYVFPLKGNLEKSYLSASKYNKKSFVSLIRYDKPMVSARSHKDYLLYLNGSHDIGHDVIDKKHFDELKKELSKMNLKPEYLWSNMDIISNDHLPYVGYIQDGLILATGYNTWGMTNGILAGKIVADIIMKRDNEYVKLFDPKRMNTSQIFSGANDIVSSISGYLNGYLKSSDNVTYENRDGREVAIYKDKDVEHVVFTKCPHLGCRLLFNEQEKTWDCPCHASRFDVDGKCISGPSNQNITYK